MVDLWHQVGIRSFKKKKKPDEQTYFPFSFSPLLRTFQLALQKGKRFGVSQSRVQILIL